MVKPPSTPYFPAWAPCCGLGGNLDKTQLSVSVLLQKQGHRRAPHFPFRSSAPSPLLDTRHRCLPPPDTRWLPLFAFPLQTIGGGPSPRRSEVPNPSLGLTWPDLRHQPGTHFSLWAPRVTGHHPSPTPPTRRLAPPSSPPLPLPRHPSSPHQHPRCGQVAACLLPPPPQAPPGPAPASQPAPATRWPPHSAFRLRLGQFGKSCRPD